MDVHHHSHSPRKKWAHYFWEFLMLFLAVTLGFFVENQREHFVEHQREKQYAKSIYDDFRVDTQVIRRTYDEKIWVIKKLDSLEAILSSGQIEENNELIYYFERFIARKDIFTSQDVTYKQLLSSGNFRYFKNVDLYKSISNYYNLNDRYFTLTEENTINNSNELSQLEADLFDPSDLNSLYASDVKNFYGMFSRPARKFRTVTNNKKLIDLLHIKVGNASSENRTASLFLHWLGNAADSIVISLKKQYRFKE